MMWRPDAKRSWTQKLTCNVIDFFMSVFNYVCWSVIRRLHSSRFRTGLQRHRRHPEYGYRNCGSLWKFICNVFSKCAQNWHLWNEGGCETGLFPPIFSLLCQETPVLISNYPDSICLSTSKRLRVEAGISLNNRNAQESFSRLRTDKCNNSLHRHYCSLHLVQWRSRQVESLHEAFIKTQLTWPNDALSQND